jgi:chloramphenicol 3-O phosphotransferase
MSVGPDPDHTLLIKMIEKRIASRVKNMGMEVNSPSKSDTPIEIIVLNGASSTGKTTLALALQDELEESWLVFGTDTLISSLPLALLEIHDDAMIAARPREHRVREGGIAFGADGEISIGSEYRRLEATWLNGLAAIAASGTRLILDEVFLDGGRSQDRFRHVFAARRIAWISVTCDNDVAVQRERDRGDRVVGASEKQSSLVHDGVDYDLVVDTTVLTPQELAQWIADHIHSATT